MNRISVAERSQQKDIRLSIQEARELTIELAGLTAKLSQTVHEVHAMLSQIRDSATQIEVKVDGGSFSN